MPKVTIDVEARFIDGVTGGATSASNSFNKLEAEARGAAKAVDTVSKKKADPKLDIDTSKFKRAIDDSDKKLSKFGKTTAEAKLAVEDKATSKIDKVLNKVKTLAGKAKSVVLTAKDHATAKITSAINWARNFAGKTYTGMLKIRDSEALSSIRKITSGAEGLVKKTWTAAVKIKDMATAPLRGIKNMLFSIKSLVLAITAGLAAKQLILNPINVADDYSSAKISFSTLLGESAGQQMMDNLDEFAKATPFNTTNVISNAQKMLAMGWDAENIIEDMEIIGNAAAATGKLDVGLESIVRALSQIKTKGRLSTEELNQLAEAGISAKAMLAENLGYGTGDEGIAAMTKDLEKGAIASNVAIEALLAGMQKYDGMMDSMANETVEGLWSQMQDAFSINIVRKWGQGLQDGAKRGFGSIVSLLDEAEVAMAEFGDTLYEVGKTISNWAADKLENTIKRITDITGSFEFKNASLGKKISMLWKGVVADPLKEWWEGGGRDKTAKTAGKIGEWMGKTITEGLLAIFGMTEVLDSETSKKLGEEGGMSIAQSFADGFKNNFDGSAITDAFVDAISNVWNALPTWAKVLIGGYVGGKVMGGVGNFIGGIGNFAGQVGSIIGTTGKVGAGGQIIGAAGLLGLLGKTGVAGVGASGILGGLANTGYALMGGTSALAMTGGQAALIGGGSILGGIATGAGLIHVGKTGYDAYQGFKEGDKTKGWANVARSGTTAVGIGAGAALGAKAGTAIGALFGGVGAIPGALIGAGLGAVAGWLGGDAIANNIEAAKYESEEMKEAIKDSDISAEELAQTFAKAKWENAKKHFGDIKLSMSEIARIADQLVWGDDMEHFDQFTTATQTAEASLQSLKSAAETTNRWMWKAGLGVDFNADEVESIVASFDEYIASAKAVVENKHYEFTAAVSLLVDTESEGGKSILDSGNAFYGKIEADLEEAGASLGDALTQALADGFINAEEQQAITAAQQKIASITEKIANAESKAELDLIKVKFGNGNLEYETFDNFMSQMQATIDARMSASDEAFVVSVSSLNLQLEEGAISQAEYDKQLQALVSGYTSKVESLQAQVEQVELQIIGEAYAKELGDDAVADLQRALQYAIDKDLDPVKISDEKMAELLQIEDLDENSETIGNIKDMLSGVLGQLELLEIDGNLMLKIGEVTTDGDVEEKIKNSLPETVEETVGVNISGEKHIQNTIDVLVEDFDIPPDKAATVALLLTGDKEILSKIDISTLAKELGVPESVAETVITKLTGSKSIEERVNVLGTDLVDTTEVWQTITVNLTSKVGQVVDKVSGFVSSIFGGGSSGGGSGGNGGDGSGYRGGIFGGDSAMDAFYRGGMTDNSGIVGGSTRYIRVNEEAPEMVIPLSSQRRGRALKLWAEAGNIMGVPGFARGGIIGGNRQDEGIRFNTYGSSNDSGGGKTVHVDVGGVKVDIHVDANGSANIVEAIKAQAGEITDVMVGIIADALEAEFENTPVRGGVA